MTAMEQLLACLPAPPGWRFDWAGLQALAPLRSCFARMQRTPQQAEWHGEGDVFTHTRMVCDALAGLAEFRALPEEQRQVLALAALLHDMAKPACTRLEDGQLVSPRHGPVGANMARTMLWLDFGLCGSAPAQRFREAVCLLIRYHTQPLHLAEKQHAETRALKLAANGELAPAFTLRALCLLSEADVLGRISADRQQLLEQVELSRELARGEGCLDGPWAFASAHTQRALFTGANVWKGQQLYDDSWGEVTLLCGLPGTGKDTWLRAQEPALPSVSLDQLRSELGVSPRAEQGAVVQAAKERARGFLRAKQPFVWNATSLTQLRGQTVSLFESYHARVRIVYLETAWEENLRRNASRPDAVPEDVIARMLDKLEPPERYEAQRVEWVCV